MAMSRIDDRIRRELKGLARPVDLEGVGEEVSRRKARRRAFRRLQVGVLASSVVIGTIAGTYGLLRVFGETPPGDVMSPRPPVMECDVSTVEADVNGDGAMDAVRVYWPSLTACEPVPERVRYRARVVISAGTPAALALRSTELPECETPATACRAFGAPDVDGDGRAEVAIAIAPGGPAAFFGIYRSDPAAASDDRALVRLTVEPPGDPWNDEYGFPPGPAVFTAYGSVTHLHWATCFVEEGERFLAASTALRTEVDPDLYDVHTTVFRVAGASLEVVMSEDGRVPTNRLETSGELCGSNLFVRD
jgi:hypothetical protein